MDCEPRKEKAGRVGGDAVKYFEEREHDKGVLQIVALYCLLLPHRDGIIPEATSAQVSASISVTNVMSFRATKVGTSEMFLRERTARGRYYDAVANQTDDELTKNNLFDEEKKDIE